MAGGAPAVPTSRSDDFRLRFLSALAAAVIRTLRATVRMRFHGDQTIRSWEQGEQRFLLAFWHRHMLLMRYAYRGKRMTVLSSRSRDGELSSRVLRRLGIDTSRGSTTRGGAMGLRDLVRRAREGSDLGFTPDGPRGPERKVQPGTVLAAAVCDLPVIPAALAARPAVELPSWDRLVVPLPGSRVEVVYGAPIRLPRDADPAEWGPRIESAINECEARAEDLARGRRTVR
ncbi:MAG: lysophospholipid acyltransferase family protein [Thermoanaerobaculia bacterium]|nr:MAG: lysophospholipid acyltransferase family protein [Thermoanaerobaculia bacterium]